MKKARQIFIIFIMTVLLAGINLADAAGSNNKGIAGQEPELVADFEGCTSVDDDYAMIQFYDRSTGDIVAWEWSFGDGGTEMVQNPVRGYSVGNYTVTLAVTDSSGNTATVTKEDCVKVGNCSVAADFSAAPTSGTGPLDVVFTDLSEGRIDTYMWNFGDGGASIEQNPSHTYTQAGNYDVTLFVIGEECGDTEAKTGYISVNCEATADFSASVFSGFVPLTIHFSDKTQGQVSSYQWFFGDGTSSTEQNPSHTYSQTGTYTVTLTVTGDGCSDTVIMEDYITATCEVEADFSATPASGSGPLTVQFSDQSSGPGSAYLWDFGDGEAGTEQNPSHTYSSSGTYTVSLSVIGPTCTDIVTKEDYISVTCEVDADFSATPTSGTVPLSVQFTDQSDGPVDTYMWDFGDGETDTEQNPSHTYSKTGIYSVRLMVTGEGCNDILKKSDYIIINSDNSSDDNNTNDKPCVTLFVLKGRQDAKKHANVLRRFRDNVLAANITGKVMTGLYYYHSDEIVEILAANPEMETTFGDILEDMTPRVTRMLGGKQVVLTKTELVRIKSLLNKLSDNAGFALQMSIAYILNQIEKGSFLQQYGISVIDS